MERAKELEAANQKQTNKNSQESNNLANKNGSTTNDQSEYDRFNRFVWSCIYNLIALFIVILFAYIVQWVLSEYNH